MRNYSIGIEIESILNRAIHSFPIGCYHSSAEPEHSRDNDEYEDDDANDNYYINSYWRVEDDGSLHPTAEVLNKWRRIGRGCEFVSDVIHSKINYDNAINSFIKKISKNGRFKLNDVICFNSTCGNHIHFSLSRERISRTTLFNGYMRLRQKFFREVKQSKVLQKKTKLKILKHYFRGYAKKSSREDIFTGYREQEFNVLGSEDEGKGMEWRSVNLYGVETWKEFKEMFKIIFSCLDYFYKITQKFNRNNNFKCKYKDLENRKMEQERVKAKYVKHRRYIINIDKSTIGGRKVYKNVTMEKLNRLNNKLHFGIDKYQFYYNKILIKNNHKIEILT